MKKLILCLMLLPSVLFAQEAKQVDLDELAVPTAPAFILLDVSSTNIETPSAPKEFSLGLVQNFDINSKWFQDYSVQFTPYWWFKPKGRDAYNFLGLKKKGNGDSLTSIKTAGLKFTDISLAFVNRDLIEDTIQQSQKVFSFGMRTTLIQIKQKQNVDEISKGLTAWHKQTLKEIEQIQNESFGIDDADSLAVIIDRVAKNNSFLSDKLSQAIVDFSREKPLFNWDLAGAMAQYGIGDSSWKMGRAGVWTTFSFFVPIGKERPYLNYFDVFISARYLTDMYFKNESNNIVQSNLMDVGGKLGFEVNRFSIFGEGILRFNSIDNKTQHRLIGMMSYRVKNNLFITGSYGVDFDPSQKTLSMFGVNWGFGNEKLAMPTSN